MRSKYIFLSIILLLWAVLTIAYVLGVRVNTSSSLPMGLYWVEDIPISRGATVWLCPPVNACLS
jgi:type IV secretory pathway protease TraF